MSNYQRAALGAFLLGGLLLFAIGLFWIGDRRQLFADSVDLYAEFANVSGLSRGAKVRVSGLDAGEVLDILVPPNPDSRFRIRFRTVAEFLPVLRTDSVATIQTDGLVGNKYLQVGIGTSAAPPATEGATIRSREPIEVADMLSKATDTIGSANTAIVDIRNGIDQTVKAVLGLNEQTTQVISNVSGQIDRFASTGNAIGNDIQAMVSGVRAGQGSLGKLLTDEEIYKQFRNIASEGERMVANFRDASDDLKTVSEDIKSRKLGEKIDTVTEKVDAFAREATSAVRSIQSPDGASGGLISDVRQTLSSANEAMANIADNSEALKRNWFFRGFFNRRGFFDLDEVTVREYQEGRFLPERQKVTEWRDSAQVFGKTPRGQEQLTEEGKRELDRAMARFLAYSKNDPLIVESWAGPGSDAETLLHARERAILVREYLIKKFDLKPNYLAIMPMNAVASSGPPRDGIGLVLFAPRPGKK